MLKKSGGAFKSFCSSTYAIARFSFIEAIRKKLFLGILLLSIPLSLAALLIDPYQLGFQVRMFLDGGLAIISMVGLLVVVFLSLEQIIPDIEKRTIYFVLTRTPNRFAYMLGKFIGICFTLFGLHVFLSLLFASLLKIRGGAWFFEIFTASFMIFLKQTLLVALIMLLSACCTKIVTLSLSVLIYVIGHSAGILRMLSDKAGNVVLDFLLNVFSVILPDFALYETRIMIMNELTLRLSSLLTLVLYTACAALFYLAIGGAVLKKKDL